jgi:hypothetical protein
MMKLTIALIFASFSTTVVYAETYNYSCKVDGKKYPLQVDDTKMFLKWRGKQYGDNLLDEASRANLSAR